MNYEDLAVLVLSTPYMIDNNLLSFDDWVNVDLREFNENNPHDNFPKYDVISPIDEYLYRDLIGFMLDRGIY